MSAVLEQVEKKAGRNGSITPAQYLAYRMTDIRRSVAKIGYGTAADAERAEALTQMAHDDGYTLTEPIKGYIVSRFRYNNDIVQCRRPKRKKQEPVTLWARIWSWIGKGK